MGCDFDWTAGEKDVSRQRKAGWFLDSLVRRYEMFDHIRFNGIYEGFFLDLENRQKVVEPTKLHLIGTSFYFKGWDFFDSPHDFARRQFSFVFNNTNDDTPQLITLETIEDFSKPKYKYYADFFAKAVRSDQELPCAAFRKGGHLRLLNSEGWFASLLYALKKQFLPGLDACDDYMYCESTFGTDIPISEDFSETIIDKSLADFWTRSTLTTTFRAKI